MLEMTVKAGVHEVIWVAPYLRAHVDIEGPDQPAHPLSLIRAFIVL